MTRLTFAFTTLCGGITFLMRLRMDAPAAKEPRSKCAERHGFRRPLWGLGFGTGKHRKGAGRIATFGSEPPEGLSLAMKKLSPPNYTQVPNAVLDAIPQMEASEMAVMLVVCRLTFGWHKEKLSVTTRRLASLTGLSKTASNRALGKLVARGWIVRVPDGRSFAYEVCLGHSVTQDEQEDRVTQLPDDGKPSDPTLGHSVTHPIVLKKEERKVPKESSLPVPESTGPWPTGSPPEIPNGTGTAHGDKSVTAGLWHAQFIALWAASWRAVFRTEYAFAGGKDAMAVKRLLAATHKPPEDLIEIAKAAWGRMGEYPFDSAASIATFNGRFNEISAKLLSVPRKVNGAHKAEATSVEERFDVPTL